MAKEETEGTEKPKKGKKGEDSKEARSEPASGGPSQAKGGAPEKAPKGEKAERAPKGEGGEGGEKAEKQAKGGGAPKGEKKGGGDKGGGGKKGKKEDAGPEKPRPPPRLWLRYKKEIAPQLMKQLGLKNVYEVPKLTKIVVNMGLGDAISNNKILDFASTEIQQITGQKPVITKAKKSIANFKLREGMPIGAMVTLRRARMWEFLDRLISIVLPRVRDFKGVSDKAFDGRGNYTLGLKEQIIFPEIDYDQVDQVRGMNIVMVTTAENDVHGKALLEALGVPMVKRGQAANG